MKHHDFKTNATHTYYDFENGRFYINSPSCILSHNQIVQFGMIYLFSDIPDESGVKLTLVELLNVRFEEGLVYLQLMDVLTGRIIDVHQIVRPKSEECTCMLLDLDYFNDKLRGKNADDFNVDNTLLEFEF